ncbi:MAG: hypothetical protein HYX67_13185 [Candidatus Melainabacteria bacterium]|nr:hypothetical protein [Candidatus Melainabacteria bacterium]
MTTLYPVEMQSLNSFLALISPTGIDPSYRPQCERFYELTHSNCDDVNAHELTQSARVVKSVIDDFRIKIYANEKVRGQWWLDRISEIKITLAAAIAFKSDYYQTNWFGIWEKFTLLSCGHWNEGFTPEIMEIEDLLLEWDSRLPVCKTNSLFSDKYQQNASFSTNSLNTSRFFNYTPTRLIELEDGNEIDYKTLHSDFNWLA